MADDVLPGSGPDFIRQRSRSASPSSGRTTNSNQHTGSSGAAGGGAAAGADGEPTVPSPPPTLPALFRRLSSRAAAQGLPAAPPAFGGQVSGLTVDTSSGGDQPQVMSSGPTLVLDATRLAEAGVLGASGNMSGIDPLWRYGRDGGVLETKHEFDDGDAGLGDAGGGADDDAEPEVTMTDDARAGVVGEGSVDLGGSGRRAITPPPAASGDGRGMVPKRKGRGVAVFARFRPENADERRAGRMGAEFGADNRQVSFTTENNVKHEFAYKRVFRPEAEQQEVYATTGRPLVDAVLRGYNAAIICYGQTGSGKTFTMFGPGVEADIDVDSERRGLVPRMVNDLMTTLQMLDPTTTAFEVRASFVQVYLKGIRDMLMPHKVDLTIREEITGHVFTDATQVPVRSAPDVFALLRQGLRNRVTAPTLANAASSRSHAIFVLDVYVTNRRTNETTTSQLLLVDLAGSEKVDRTGATGLTLAQAQMINKALLALGNVVAALTTGGGRRHVPYRDSKLTRLLANCFGGNALTHLVVNCSPSTFNGAETISTLRFGARANYVDNAPVANKVRSMAKLRRLLDKANSELLAQSQAMLQMNRALRFLRAKAMDMIDSRPSIVRERVRMMYPMCLPNRHATGKRFPLAFIAYSLTFCNGHTLARCAMVCRAWRDLCKGDSIWATACKLEFGLNEKPDDVTWEMLYRQRRHAALQQLMSHRRQAMDAARVQSGLFGVGLTLLPSV